MLEAKDELQILNKKRRELIHDIFRTKKKQEDIMQRIQQDVQSYLEDHAEKYFSSDHAEYANKTFKKKYDASLKAMKTEIRQLEATIGINLSDMDEELDRSISKLAQKEKEYDSLEETLRMPIQETNDYKQLIQKFLSHSLDIDLDKEYARLQSRLELNEHFSSSLLSTYTKRQSQLDKELKDLVQILQNQKIGKKSSLEALVSSIERELEGKREKYIGHVDYEVEQVMKIAQLDQLKLHEEYMERYRRHVGEVMKGKREKKAGVKGGAGGGGVGGGKKKEEKKSIEEHRTTHKPIKTKEGKEKKGGKGKEEREMSPEGEGEEEEEIEVEIATRPHEPPHWKSELLEGQSKALSQSQHRREDEEVQDLLLLQALQQREEYEWDPSPVADISHKLSLLYMKHNTTILKNARKRYNSN